MLNKLLRSDSNWGCCNFDKSKISYTPIHTLAINFYCTVVLKVNSFKSFRCSSLSSFLFKIESNLFSLFELNDTGCPNVDLRISEILIKSLCEQFDTILVVGKTAALLQDIYQHHSDTSSVCYLVKGTSLYNARIV